MPSDKELTGAQKGASRRDRIQAILIERFKPSALTLTDDSDRHHGHAGASPEGETHFSVEIISAAFAGQSRVARQRGIMEALNDEFASGLHALSIRARAPDERTGE